MRNIADDERIRILNDQIQAERDPKQLLALVQELTRVLDDQSQRGRPQPASPKD